MKSLALDLGGVLLMDGKENVWKTLEDKLQINNDLEKLWKEKYRDKIHLGKMDEKILWDDLMKQSSIHIGANDVRKLFLDSFTPVYFNVETIRAAKESGWQVIVATNNYTPWVDYWQEKYHYWFCLIDLIICSDQVGKMKPDKDYFNKLKEIANHDLIFVDDKKDNVDAAISCEIISFQAANDGSWHIPS